MVFGISFTIRTKIVFVESIVSPNAMVMTSLCTVSAASSPSYSVTNESKSLMHRTRCHNGSFV